MIRPFSLVLFVGLAACGAAGQAAAAVFCVSTGNDLASALATAAGNNQNDEIRVLIGTMTCTGISGTVPRWEYNTYGRSDGNLQLVVSGGWTDCSTQVQDPRLTVLDAAYQGSAFNIEMDSGQGSIRVTNLTITRGFHNGNSLGGAGEAANLEVYAPYSTLSVTFDRLIVIAGSATNNTVVTGGIRIYGWGMTITISNNIIAYNSAIVAAGLEVAVSDSIVSVNKNSLFSNSSSSTISTTRGVGFGLSNDNGNSYVANNVVVGNTRGDGSVHDFENERGNSYLRNNHIGVGYFEIAPIVNLNPTTGDPGWTLTGIYPTPNEVSPLRDSGTNSPYGGVGTVDLAGNARIVNATVDRGAIEAAANAPTDRIFADAFESPQ